ncbi:1387_t:CDS:2 [Funneliformis geosporum]|uniref:1387_t:CDS:1 n=1 Tax=Funneliformis geosporum TaxID=1117311 RepID=A0A9W4SZ65_9GLOM|nr:1387_t:CDS:2 [Funneliformis geosporum]
MKDVQTYQYYKDSMRIQSTYRVQLEENDAHIEIGKNTGKYTICGINTNDEAIDDALLDRLIILIDKLELNKQDALDNMNQTQE